MTDPAAADELVVIGRVRGVFGVRGWVKVLSYTRPSEAILQYNPWFLRTGEQWGTVRLVSGRRQAKGVIACFEGCSDRDQASAWVGAEIAVTRAQLPRLQPGEYYWTQLEGLRVINLAGDELGRVDHLLETGANDVLVVEGDRQRLIPYIPDVIRKVDLDSGTMLVDWDVDF